MPGDVFIHDTYFIVNGSPLVWLVMFAWIGLLGAIIGSFLNVVVYRLPRGMSLSVPGSHCPKCNHAIRWYDNLPVVGWLKLRGRCRDCGTAISARYPLVEALVASMFVALAYVDLLYGTLDRDTAIEPAAWAGFALHPLLLTTLLAAALIKYDAQPLPVRLFWPAVVVAIGVSIIWPAAFRLPLAWYPGDRFAHLEASPLGWPECLGGLVAGFIVGSILTMLIRSTGAASLFGNLTAELLTLGCCLGWQATVWASLCVLVGVWLATRNVRLVVGSVFIAAATWVVGAQSIFDASGRQATAHLPDVHSPYDTQGLQNLRQTTGK